MDFGCGYYTGLYGNPAILPVTGPGEITIKLADLHSGHEVRIKITRLEWLRQLASALVAAEAEGIVEAGMAAAS
jgi:hypothetical protein